MKRIFGLLPIFSLLISGAVAQDNPEIRKMTVVLSELQDSLKQAKVMSIGGAVMGPAIKNAPYAAV